MKSNTLILYDVTVVVQKTVMVGITIVAKPSTTLLAIPCGILSNAFCLAFHASTTLVVCCTIDCNCCWEVAEWDRSENTTTTAWSTASTIVGNELTRQLQTKILDILVDYRRRVVLVYDVCICNAYIIQKEEDVLVELPTLRSAGIVAATLVSPVYSTHEVVIIDDGFRARYLSSASILLTSWNSSSGGRLAVCVHYCDFLVVHPGRCSELPFLYCQCLSPASFVSQISDYMCMCSA